MKTENCPNWLKKLTGFVGIASASALIGVPAWAHLNANNSALMAATAPNVEKPMKIAAAKDIVATAAGSGKFTTLEKALKAADLVTTLQGKGPFTVFAPTDQAFAALPKATLDDLLKPANKAKLAKILKYHVVAGQYLSTSLKSGEVPTVEGSKVKVQVTGGKVTVGGANVTQADIKASNGVIHVIDKVIMPPDVK